MTASRPLILVYLLLCRSCCDAKIINAEANASYVSRVGAGVAQALQWMTDWVSEHPARPAKKVELAIVGFGRTGSTSFVTALKELGHTPIHDDEMAEVSDLYHAWFKGAMPIDKFNDELGKRGFDAPWLPIHKYVEWAGGRPDVKVILTVRDKKKWAQSYLAIVDTAFLPTYRPFKWIKMMEEMKDVNMELVINVPTNGKPALYKDAATLEAGYDAWVEFVRKTVPKERLLEFDVKQGWAPLCQFLGKPIPSTPFPHINDRVVVDTMVKVFVAVTWVWPLLFALPVLILWCCCRCCCRTKSKDDVKKHD